MATGVTVGDAKPDSDEFVELQPRTLSQALRMIQAGGIQDAKTIVTILYAAGFEIG